MHPPIPLLSIVVGGLTAAFAAEPLPPPLLDLRQPERPPVLGTWAFAEGRATLRIESTAALQLSTNQFQVDGKSVIPLADHQPLGSFNPGLNLLEIPLPAKAQRGKVLCKIGAASEAKPDGELIVNLMVDILPRDAWASLSKHAKNGQLFINPAYKEFKAWANGHDLPSLPVPPTELILYYFGKPGGPSEAPPPARFIIYERAAPDPLPVIEVMASPNVTKIIVPPGFLQQVPDSAAAQALLLKHLTLLP